MDAFRARMRRPEPAVAVGLLLVLTGLIAAVVLGNTLASSRPSAAPSATVSSPARQSPTLAPIGAAGSPTPSSSLVGAISESEGWEPVGWSPDGSTLLLKRDGVFAIVTDSAPQRPLITPLQARAAQWWPGGDRVLSLVVRDLDSESLVITGVGDDVGRALVRESPIDAVDWTPDGQSVAVGSPSGVLVGSFQGRLGRASSTPAARIALSADGLHVASLWPKEADRGSLELLDLGRGVATTSIDSGMIGLDAALAWSSKRPTLALTRSTGRDQELRVLTPAISLEETLLASAVDPSSARWSPDGGWLAVSRATGAGSEYEVVVIEITPGAARLQPLGSGRVTAWSADSRTLLTVDSFGNLVGYAVPRVDPAGRASSPTPQQRPTIYAADADPDCMPAFSSRGVIAYCDKDGLVRLTNPP